MAATFPRASSRKSERQARMLDRLKRAAEELGLTDVESDESAEVQRRYSAILAFEKDRRIYVSRSHTTETISLYVGDGGSGELRYDPDSRKWHAEFGGVPILRDAENELDQVLRYLMGS